MKRYMTLERVFELFYETTFGAKPYFRKAIFKSFRKIMNFAVYYLRQNVQRQE